jgi:hypothetical protein
LKVSGVEMATISNSFFDQRSKLCGAATGIAFSTAKNVLKQKKWPNC